MNVGDGKVKRAPGQDTIRLLLTARDPGAAGHIAEIFAASQADERFHPLLAASGPALSLLGAQGLPVRPFGQRPLPVTTDQLPAAILREAERLVAECSPDALVVGLSHRREIGLDEISLLCAGGRPSFAMQDFWGDVRQVPAGPGHYLVIDDIAAGYTRARADVPVTVVGSPKHARYSRLDPLSMRHDLRRQLGCGADTPVIGYFGQCLHEFGGYADMLRALAAVVAQELPEALLLLRPHPREEPGAAEPYLAVFEAAGLRPVIADGLPVEPVLCASDIVLSCFSTCGYDALHLARTAPEPLNVVIFLDFPDDLQRYRLAATELDELPPVEAGAALKADGADSLRQLLGTALAPATRAAMHRRARDWLPDPGSAPRRVLDIIHAQMSQSAADAPSPAAGIAPAALARPR